LLTTVTQLLAVSTTQETLSAGEYDAQVALQHKAINAIKQSDKQFDDKPADKRDDSEEDIEVCQQFCRRDDVRC